jgi:hypothetical protein
LAKAKIQISIYSTTFYDALGFDVCNFSLQEYGSMSDYAADMISESVALPLLIHENPVEKFLSLNNIENPLATREEVYSLFDKQILLEAIELNGVHN